ncbi:FecR family protein [Flagellimonas pacifica]|uniref:FecR family protein n=1 Tax=Flagellimonas pacifica TaxID=1247520 RepID=A0A285ME04_9FLAO|nr:FecR domain-containing protein [Allomuricauda parva]SNY95405.1 FecR family protein [Allomuricauda parva]
MTDKKLEILLQRFRQGGLTEKELDNLIDLLSDEKTKKKYKESVEVEYLLSIKYVDIDPKAAYLDFLSKKSLRDRSGNALRKRRNAFFGYAAVFLGFIGLGYLLWLNNGKELSPSPLIEIEEKAITLQLESGKTKVIHEDGSSQITDENGRTLAVQKDGGITYEENTDIEKLVYNELHVPYGKKFRIELSDGTMVHLNSGSSLKYPIKFLKGKNRDVFIDGEAFFDVIEDKEHPFTVHAGEVNVRVLGTNFNVSSYKEDVSVNTVLVSGHVKLYDASDRYDSKTSFDIEPEQMGVWNKEQGEFSSKQVDTNIHTAWMQGKLIFRDMPFKDIRKKLERHYNVSIVNSNEVFDENTFSAAFDIENIEEVLETFSRNFGIKYEIINNEVIIKPKN